MAAPAPKPALPEQDERTLRILASVAADTLGYGPEAEAEILAAWRETIARIDGALA